LTCITIHRSGRTQSRRFGCFLFIAKGPILWLWLLFDSQLVIIEVTDKKKEN